VFTKKRALPLPPALPLKILCAGRFTAWPVPFFGISRPKLVVTLKLHSRGDAVRALQHQLRYAYGHRSVVDGYLARRPWLR
jgi:hypothetical protein